MREKRQKSLKKKPRQTVEKRVHQALKVTSNGTSVLCRNEVW